MIQNSHESRRKYWATRSSVCSFACTAHSLVCSILLDLLVCSTFCNILSYLPFFSLAPSLTPDWLFLFYFLFWTIAMSETVSKPHFMTTLTEGGLPCSWFDESSKRLVTRRTHNWVLLVSLTWCWAAKASQNWEWRRMDRRTDTPSHRDVQTHLNKSDRNQMRSGELLAYLSLNCLLNGSLKRNRLWKFDILLTWEHRGWERGWTPFSSCLNISVSTKKKNVFSQKKKGKSLQHSR